MGEEAYSVKGAREFLLSPEGTAPDDYISKMIEDHLPANWRKLITTYGHHKVFECLRAGHTIGGAMFICMQGRRRPKKRRRA